MQSTCAYQGVRSVSFKENFAYVLKSFLVAYFSILHRLKTPENIWFSDGLFNGNIG